MVENKNRLVASTEPVANHSSGGQENAALAVLTRDSIRKGVHMMRILNGNAELTINQTSTLNQLKEGPRPMALMARLSGVSQPSMSQHASALEALGYIKRSRAPQDGRAVILSITDSGREAVDRVNLTRNSALQELFAQLSAEERDSLTSGLRVLEQLAESTIQDSSRNS
ncbi:MarR family winged helix-turn-helix transcriptional regulator [uncultured Corynebacterium sp.]|uniref:MarR family winged helix-turn-helix transcriptional regulator n=1 Tax=uncultured Corynebacterium sp. TaxID=159447 RepID=UPI0025DC4279|nr:MarR family transcriptional regulator [uncultured Corynebacterium sp.]